MGIVVHLIPTGVVREREREAWSRCHIVHAANDWQACEDRHVLSFCNGSFLENAKTIRRYARSMTFIGCMCWVFDAEKKALSDGCLDLSLYQTDHQMRIVSRRLAGYSSYRPMRFTPYFDDSRFSRTTVNTNGRFCIGRLSRADPAKFHANSLNILRGVDVPGKTALILGWSDDICIKCGDAPPWLQTADPGDITQSDFYSRIDVLCMHEDCLENLPRVGFEAMASGIPIVADRRGGWCLQVDDGETGLLCSKSEEFVAALEKMADREFRGFLSERAARKLSAWNFESSSRSWAQVFEVLESV